MVPEKRGQQTVAEFHAHLAHVEATVAKYAKTDAQKQVMAQQLARYRAGYEKRFVAWLGARSRCVSVMIAGPSKFPVRQMEKRNQSERNRLDDLVRYQDRALRAMIRAIEKVDAPSPADALRAKLAKAEARQEMMKAANKVVKSKKLTADQKVQQLTAIVGSEAVARSLLEPDYCGRLGYADFELKNNNANIRRMRQQLAEYERRADRVTRETRFDGGVIVENAEADRLQIIFDAKPAPELRAKLKARGFRWAPSEGAWQRQLTDNAVQAAREILADQIALSQLLAGLAAELPEYVENP